MGTENIAVLKDNRPTRDKLRRQAMNHGVKGMEISSRWLKAVVGGQALIMVSGAVLSGRRATRVIDKSHRRINGE